MLKVMRDSFQHLKWILVFVILVFVLFIFVDWGTGRASLEESDAFAARVNGDTISVRDLSRAVYYTEQQYRQMYGERLSPELLQQM
ncbi:MAG TPA: SurA N-terminal domain-containing protein, partial [Thermoanaerobaculia bacterium]